MLDFAVHDNGLEARSRPRRFQQLPDRGVLRKNLRLLGYVDALDARALPLEPVHVGGKGVSSAWSTSAPQNAAAATQRRVENLDRRHDGYPSRVSVPILSSAIFKAALSCFSDSSG